jgi:hypothetical protein
VKIYEELKLSAENDLGVSQDASDACVISKKFVTSFCKHVETVAKSLFDSKDMPPGGDLHCLDFGELGHPLQNELNDKVSSKKDSDDNDALDIKINSGITCKSHHDSLLILLFRYLYPLFRRT